MWLSMILAVLALASAAQPATAMPDQSASARFEAEISGFTSRVRDWGGSSIPHAFRETLARSVPTPHPWGGSVWFDDGFVTIDKADLGPVAARRPAFTLGFQRLPQSECRRLMTVTDGMNIAGEGILQVSAKNVVSGRFVSFKGAELDTTTDQVDVACGGEDDLFTVTIAFELRDKG